MQPGCPLCASSATQRLAEAHGRRYFGCRRCRLRFMDPEARPTFSQMQQLFALRALGLSSRRVTPPSALVQRLTRNPPPAACGVLVGWSDSEVVSAELGGAFGLVVLGSSPSQSDVAEARYGFALLLQAAEHFEHPASEFSAISRCLLPRSPLVVALRVFDPRERFETWPDVADPTQLCFYEEETLRWLAARFAWELIPPFGEPALFVKGPD